MILKLFKDLTRMCCFTLSDVIMLAGSATAAQWYIRTYLELGFIERVRRNLYTAINLSSGSPVANRYQIASKASDDATVVLHSAFEYYGCANQVFYEVYTSSSQRMRPFSYDGLRFLQMNCFSKEGICENSDSVRVSSLERTVIDSIASFEKCAGLEELLRCITIVPQLNPDGLLEILSVYNQQKLYQKAGYILESMNDILGLPESLFNACENKAGITKNYLSQDHEDCVLHRRWNLYAPENLKQIISKGDYS